jgi:hypothetical protein
MATVVTPTLILKHVRESDVLRKAYEIVENDEEVQELIKMANVMAVGRLKYNDHGIVHSRIVAGASLELLHLLLESGIKPTTLNDGIAKSMDEVKVVVLLGAYLHDIGNAIHRANHEALGAMMSKDILDRLLSDIFPGIGKRKYSLRQEIMHAIYATETNIRALTIEAGVVKIGDGTDMAEGRARIPYNKMGRLDMHAVSAISIKKVIISRGNNAPARIDVEMNDYAGLFQIEAVLRPKILTSGLDKYLEVYINVGDKEHRVHPL